MQLRQCSVISERYLNNTRFLSVAGEITKKRRQAAAAAGGTNKIMAPLPGTSTNV